MKKNITKEQWYELTHEQKNILDGYGCKEDWRMTIGQMIYFLGSDLSSIEYNDEYLVVTHFWDKDGHRIMFEEKELIDALWSACKYKTI